MNGLINTAIGGVEDNVRLQSPTRLSPRPGIKRGHSQHQRQQPPERRNSLLAEALLEDSSKLRTSLKSSSHDGLLKMRSLLDQAWMESGPALSPVSVSSPPKNKKKGGDVPPSPPTRGGKKKDVAPQIVKRKSSLNKRQSKQQAAAQQSSQERASPIESGASGRIEALERVVRTILFEENNVDGNSGRRSSEAAAANVEMCHKAMQKYLRVKYEANALASEMGKLKQQLTRQQKEQSDAAALQRSKLTSLVSTMKANHSKLQHEFGAQLRTLNAELKECSEQLRLKSARIQDLERQLSGLRVQQMQQHEESSADDDDDQSTTTSASAGTSEDDELMESLHQSQLESVHLHEQLVEARKQLQDMQSKVEMLESFVVTEHDGEQQRQLQHLLLKDEGQSFLQSSIRMREEQQAAALEEARNENAQLKAEVSKLRNDLLVARYVSEEGKERKNDTDIVKNTAELNALINLRSGTPSKQTRVRRREAVGDGVDDDQSKATASTAASSAKRMQVGVAGPRGGSPAYSNASHHQRLAARAKSWDGHSSSPSLRSNNAGSTRSAAPTRAFSGTEPSSDGPYRFTKARSFFVSAMKNAQTSNPDGGVAPRSKDAKKLAII